MTRMGMGKNFHPAHVYSCPLWLLGGQQLEWVQMGRPPILNPLLAFGGELRWLKVVHLEIKVEFDQKKIPFEIKANIGQKNGTKKWHLTD